MRILTVTNLYPPHAYGGYEMSCRDVVDRLRARGHEVAVLTGDARLDGAADEDLGYPVHRAMHMWWDWDRFGPSMPPVPDRVRHERATQRAARRVLREFRPDVASVWGMGAVSMSVLSLIERARVPMVLTLQELWPTYAPAWDAWHRMFAKRPWARPLGRLLPLETRPPRLRDAVVDFVSNDTRQRVLTYRMLDLPDGQVVPLGIDHTDFPPTEPRDDPWQWRLLYVGRLDRNKGIATLVAALPLLPARTTLDVIGSGDPELRRQLEAQAAALGVGDRVGFTACPRAQLRSRYRSADVLVFPSEWPEPFGLVPIEAMACATPVVATGTGGSGDYLVDGRNCLLFRAGDADDLALAVRRVADDADLRRRIVANGLDTARTFTVDRYADVLERLHEQAAARRR